MMLGAVQSASADDEPDWCEQSRGQNILIKTSGIPY